MLKLFRTEVDHFCCLAKKHIIAGADVNSKDSLGRTALIAAASNESLGTVQVERIYSVEFLLAYEMLIYCYASHWGILTEV